MASVAVYRFKVWDQLKGDFHEDSTPMATLEAIKGIQGAVAIEDSGVEVDEIFVGRKVLGMTVHHFDPENPENVSVSQQGLLIEVSGDYRNVRVVGAIRPAALDDYATGYPRAGIPERYRLPFVESNAELIWPIVKRVYDQAGPTAIDVRFGRQLAIVDIDAGLAQ